VLGRPHPNIPSFCKWFFAECYLCVQFKWCTNLRVHFCQVPQNHTLICFFCIFCFNVTIYDFFLNWDPWRFLVVGKWAYLSPLPGWLTIDKDISCIGIDLGIRFFFSSLSRHTIFSWHTSFQRHTDDPVATHRLRNSGVGVSCCTDLVRGLSFTDALETFVNLSILNKSVFKTWGRFGFKWRQSTIVMATYGEWLSFECGKYMWL